MTIRQLLGGALSLLALTNWNPAAAAGSDPIRLEADRMSLDQSSGEGLYQGHVKMTQGRVRIEAERIRVLAPAEGQERTLEISGTPARFWSTDSAGLEVRGEAEKIHYNSSREIATLTGQARFWRDGNEFSSERIVYDAANEQLQAGGDQAGQRARMVIQPRQKPEASQ